MSSIAALEHHGTAGVAGTAIPDQAKALAMPTEDGLRLHDHQGGRPSRPELPRDHPERAVERSNRRLPFFAHERGKLLTESEVLEDQIAPRAEHRNDQADEQDRCAHRAITMPLLRRRFQPDRLFGEAQGTRMTLPGSPNLMNAVIFSDSSNAIFGAVLGI
jgi:hypothetical protein